eukprot:7794870-Heterocapsa_arctica.AAC.1
MSEAQDTHTTDQPITSMCPLASVFVRPNQRPVRHSKANGRSHGCTTPSHAHSVIALRRARFYNTIVKRLPVARPPLPPATDTPPPDAHCETTCHSVMPPCQDAHAMLSKDLGR